MYVDMDSVLSNNPAPDINASKPEALQILKLILGNNSMTIFDAQKNVDSTDGKIVILKPCWLPCMRHYNPLLIINCGF